MSRTELSAVGLLALCHRLIWLQWPSWTVGDSPGYLALGRSIIVRRLFSEDGLTPSTYRPPLYPMLLAACSVISNHPIATVLIIQVLLGTSTVLLTCSVAARFFGRRVAFLAGTLLALAPMTARYSAEVLTETLFTFLLIAGVHAWGRQNGVLAGLALGGAVLTRAVALPFVVLVGVLGLLPLRVDRRLCGTISIVALLTVTPWIVRNAIETGHVTVADAGWGVTLLYGTVDLHRGSNRWEQIARATNLQPGGVPTGEQEKLAAREALDWIRSHPWQWIRARVHQYPFLFIDTGDYLPVRANTYSFDQARVEHRWGTIVLKLVFVLGNAAMVLLAAVGAWVSRHRPGELLPLWSFPAFFTVAQLPMAVEPRYGLPLVPFVVVFAAAGMIALTRADRPSPRRRSP